MPDEQRAVEAFLYREARLMDEGRHKEWLDLFTEDALYWIPSNQDDIDPEGHASIIYAPRPQLEALVARLASGPIYTQLPASRMRRLVSNVELEEAERGEIAVSANFNLTEVRLGKQRTLAGRSLYRLRRNDGEFRIAFKKVELVANDEVIENLTFLV